MATPPRSAEVGNPIVPPDLPDQLWKRIRPLLGTPSPRRGGRPGVSDRACLTGILFILWTDCPWRDLPQELGCGSGMTCWRRWERWKRSGVWSAMETILRAELGPLTPIEQLAALCEPEGDGIPHRPSPTGAAQGLDDRNRSRSGARQIRDARRRRKHSGSDQARCVERELARGYIGQVAEPTSDPIPIFAPEHLERICKVLADTATGMTESEIGQTLQACQIPDVDYTPEKRLFNAFFDFQLQHQAGNHVVAFIVRAMNPAGYTDRPHVFRLRRDRLNTVLQSRGLTLGDDGKVRHVQLGPRNAPPDP